MRFTQEYLMLPSQSVSTRCFFKWLPSAESDSSMSSNPTFYWPNVERRYRKAQLTRVQAEYSQASHAGLLQAYEERHKVEIERLPVLMKWSVELYTWKQERHTCFLEVKKKNDAFAQLLATEEGWTTYDLVNSQTYGALFRNRTNNLEEVKMSEYESIRVIVDAEMTKIIESRKRSSHEEAYRRRRSDVEQHYNRLKSFGKEKVLPNLAEFRRLPIINVLQSKTSATTGVAGDLQKSQLVAELLQDDLSKWRESARIALTHTLGFSGWKSASKTKLHPVDRLTARFRCKKCAQNDHKVYEEGCLDFAGACVHVCLRPNLKKRTRDRWTADQFEKDEKAIDVISKVLELCGVNAEERESIQKVEALGSRIKCQSCESKITMTFRNLIGHAQRHQNMQLSLVSAEEAGSFSMRHSEFGTCSKMLGPKLQAKKLRDLQNYGCRHCQHVATGGTSNATTGTEVWRFSKRSPATNVTRLFNFNGLRSHLKEKHGIERICDEDIFWGKALVWT
ncbi:hypothetical protein PILCRDRAFT_315239 [Piloderma croceum F 1598]|uniref:Uncharacterized protein n=1 Tax=Piloderma croceum (strain F 1598) TaxID=765440 RepID=A0A0C3G4M4_PILCF|nr:hypothetical protein PILCRDRAFT_315239 [Piloderma croceum F 1598]